MKVNDAFYIQPSQFVGVDELDSLMVVYTPSIGSLAVSTYLMLSSFSHTQTTFVPMRKVLDFLNCSVDDFEKSLQKCEQFKLISTHIQSKKNQDFYVFELLKPLRIAQFIHHDVFGRYLVKIMDASYLNQIKESQFRKKQDLVAYKNITREFDASLLPSWDQQLEVAYKTKPPLKIDDLPDSLQFDMDLFLKSVSPLLFPVQAQTKENIQKIHQLGSLYGIDVVSMKGFVGKCTKPSSDFLDVAKLESLVLGFINKHATSTTSVYLEDSYRFFSSKQQGKALGVRDKKTIAFLYEHYSFDQEVQNRLIDYVLTRFNGSFTKSLVQQIADSWVRAKIHSVSDVKKHLSMQKQKSIVQDVPDYMEPQAKKTATTIDESKRKELLEKLRKGE